MKDGPIAYYFGCDRIEVIGPDGRQYAWWAEEPIGIELNRQDQGRTLKIFIGGTESSK